jgi:hypothetical protein
LNNEVRIWGLGPGADDPEHFTTAMRIGEQHFTSNNGALHWGKYRHDGFAIIIAEKAGRFVVRPKRW